MTHANENPTSTQKMDDYLKSQYNMSQTRLDKIEANPVGRSRLSENLANDTKAQEREWLQKMVNAKGFGLVTECAVCGKLLGVEKREQYYLCPRDEAFRSQIEYYAKGGKISPQEVQLAIQSAKVQKITSRGPYFPNPEAQKFRKVKWQG